MISLQEIKKRNTRKKIFFNKIRLFKEGKFIVQLKNCLEFRILGQTVK